MKNWKVPLFRTEISDSDRAAVDRVLLSGWLTMGPEVEALEEDFSDLVGTDYAVAVSSGTAALHLAMIACGIGPGDEVLCPSITFVATANAIRYCGARPVFCESRGDDRLGIDWGDAAQRITPRTRAIVVVHYAGDPCNMTAIMALAKAYNLRVIEDCAHALISEVEFGGDTYKCGAVGDVGCFSFYSNKNATCGEGGMLVTSDSRISDMASRLRSHGMTVSAYDRDRGGADYEIEGLGFNYRMDEMRAALVGSQLSRLSTFHGERIRINGYYREDLPSDVIMVNGDPGLSALHLAATLLPIGADRNGIRRKMAEDGIQTGVHYHPLHAMPEFESGPVCKKCGQKHMPSPSLPKTEALAARELTLPLYPAMRAPDVAEVVASFRKALGR